MEWTDCIRCCDVIEDIRGKPLCEKCDEMHFKEFSENSLNKGKTKTLVC